MTKKDVVPVGWSFCTIGDVVAYDGIFKDGDWIESKDQDPDGDIRLIQLADVGDGYFVNKSARFLTKSKALELNCTFLREGDLLIARMPDPLGRCCIFPLTGDDKYVTVVDVCVVRLGESSNLHKHMMYLVNSPVFRAAISSLQSGSTRKRISRKNLATIKLPLAPYNEQYRIVAKIEELFSELDKGIESLKTAREQLKIFRQAVLKHAFEGKLTAQWREENKGKLETADQLLVRIQKEREARYQKMIEEWKTAVKEWEKGEKRGKKPRAPLKVKKLSLISSSEKEKLGVLPVGWHWTKIGLIASVGTGVTPLKSNAQYYVDGDIAWVTSGALNDPFVHKPTHYVTEYALNETNLRIYKPNTLVVALYGEGKTRGKCSELLIEATINQAIAAIVQEGTSSKYREFLKWFLVKNYEAMRLGASGGVQPNLNLGIIENMAIPICSTGEAREVASILGGEFSIIDQLESDIIFQLEKCKILRQSILKKAFSGQLVEQDPNDEPASVLLERIKAEKAQQQPKRKTVRKRKAVTA